ncbi:PREDICTED: lymphokine-activated killer T-cell-originated protein kinase [Ceratosolen solmsi marchali]|uniref:Lymphokine-activated killer T-cell-originated protein kinase n=1 Tax=Ceratosolen solmsi marchali TaxID=326594 RepID=A0AAJ6YRE5_9HYME|nr:PREDICTED: lymphokine-activated killer T-cell-originated protein kinase [Ceratosolen solmsi marchali]
MDEFKTPTSKKSKIKGTNNEELNTPIKIPSSPFLKEIGYGCGVTLFKLERSPKVGFTRSPWAIKKRNRNITDDTRYNSRIIFEANILKKLEHPNIVGFRAFTYGLNGDPCLAMEKLDISLGDLIEEKVDAGEPQFSAEKILKISYEIVKGLEYLHHTAYILHGDIKSYNILISKDHNIVKICDFGVSVPLNKSLEVDMKNGEFSYIGTRCWSAPEVINEEGPITNKADIWAYGLVLWEMIALSPPHVENADKSMSICTDNSMLECKSIDTSKENNDRNLNTEDSFIQSLKDPDDSNYGTRPPLPAINLGPEYDRVLEIFCICTDTDFKTRPSAKGVISFFKYCVRDITDKI